MTLSTNSALVVSPASTNDVDVLALPIREAKPLVRIPGGWEWLWISLGVLAALAVVALVWRRARRRAARPVVVPPIPPHVRARQRLEEALRYLSDARLFCIAVSDALRVYLEERFQLRAPERTTEEFLQDLQTTAVLNTEQKLTLADFLGQCDLVKFARFEPTEAALRELHETALRLVDETRYEPVAPAGEPAAVQAEKAKSET